MLQTEAEAVGVPRSAPLLFEMAEVEASRMFRVDRAVTRFREALAAAAAARRLLQRVEYQSQHLLE